MTVREAAVRLEVSPAMVYGLIAAGKLRCYRMGKGRGVFRIADQHIEDYLKSAEEGNAPPPAPTEPIRVAREPLNLKHLRARSS